MTDLSLLEKKTLLRPDEVWPLLRVSRSTIYNLMKTGELETVKVGRSLRIKAESVRGLITEKRER